MHFPRLVYRCPGPFACQGGTYDHALVIDLAQFDARIGDGWSETLPGALMPKHEPAKLGEVLPPDWPLQPTLPTTAPVSVIVSPDDNSAPTHKELKQKATELGLTFPFNVKSSKLAEMIEQALAAPAKE
jgi:hypothetical protein